MKTTTTNKPYHFLLEALRAAGMGLGIYLTKPTLEKRLFKSMHLADTGIKKTVSHPGKDRLSNPVTFELAGLGGIAAYKIYKGMKKNKKANIVEGIFLTTVLAAALVYTAGLSKRR